MLHDPGLDPGGVPELAFPDDQNLPAQAAEAADVLPVVRDIPRELLRPESPVALGGGGTLATLVPVPETAMDGQRLCRIKAGKMRGASRFLLDQAEGFLCKSPDFSNDVGQRRSLEAVPAEECSPLLLPGKITGKFIA